MSDDTAVEPVERVSRSGLGSSAIPTVVYVLYLVAAFTGVPWLVGLILAYVARDEADEVAATHFQYQIRTFWLGLLYVLVGAATMVIGIGFFICLFTWIWAIVRSFKGLGWYNSGEEVPDPKTWLW